MSDENGMYRAVSWMVPADDAILRLLAADRRLVMTPTLLGESLEFSSSHMHTRTSILAEHGLIEKREQGRCSITDLGMAYVNGSIPPDELEPDEDDDGD